jgi:ligand-binding SRPBCC domain-containing protein
MGIHQLHRTQVIEASLYDCWGFFSNPGNLSRITPANLHLELIHELPPVMYAGLFIEYRVRPFRGVKFTWLTEITRVEEGRYFIDEQRLGPYRLWHHEHHFRALDDHRTEMRDSIWYMLPFSPWSEFAHSWLVRPRLKQIFDYRERVTTEIFTALRKGESSIAPPVL